MNEDKKYIELQLYHDKVQAEINNLLAQTARANIERDKMVAETAKVYKEIKWYEIVIIVSATLAVVAIVKFFYSVN